MHSYDHPPVYWRFLYPIGAFVICIMWIYLSADLLVDLLRVAGNILCK